MKTVEHKKIINIIVGVIAIVVIITNFFIYSGGLKTKTIPPAQNLGFERLEQHMAVGVVEKISDKEIVLKDVKKIPDKTASVDQAESIVVTIDQATVIERFVQKDPVSIKNDLENFVERQKKLQNTTTSATPPEPFTRIKVIFDDIKVGDTIVVFSSVDITKLTSFVATEINIQPIVDVI